MEYHKVNSIFVFEVYNIIKKIVSAIFQITKYIAYWIYVYIMVFFIRKKPVIKVLFVISEVSSWKTELLYIKMKEHPRFNPILGVSTSTVPANAKEPLINYIESKRYDYLDLDERENSINNIAPDIIFYYKPYKACYSKGHYYNDNYKRVFCGLNYGFSIKKDVSSRQKPLYDYCWQFYVENKEIVERQKQILGFKAHNAKFTGIPMQDVLLMSKVNYPDPWKDKEGRKRIIYAPHHSIQGTNGDGVEFSTFLDYGDAILAFAKKYKEQLTIAFKPHPNLYMKLVSIWGQNKTDLYYKEWTEMTNTQLETGEYVGLFKHSDAIIHDSASFILEYLYMDKPSMYLVAKTNNIDEMFDYVKEGYNCYEHGKCLEDIESFINNVINGIDKNQEKRSHFIVDHLLPPGGKTACDNIISAILGQ